MNHPTPFISASHRRQNAGFLLNELLVSLGIFAIGMAALASLLPAAALLQRETAQQVFASAAAQSARSVVQARPLTYDTTDPSAGDLGGYHVQAAQAGSSKRDAVPLARLTTAFPPAMRSYPTASVKPNAPTPEQQIEDADLYWVPFVQDLNGKDTGSGQNWVMRIFILEADSRANYNQTGNSVANPAPGDPNNFPKVVSVTCSASGNIFTISGGHTILAGGVVMDNNGVAHTVTQVDGNQVTVAQTIANAPTAPNKLWYAPPSGGSTNPARAVETINLRVVPHTP